MNDTTPTPCHAEPHDDLLHSTILRGQRDLIELRRQHPAPAVASARPRRLAHLGAALAIVLAGLVAVIGLSGQSTASASALALDPGQAVSFTRLDADDLGGSAVTAALQPIASRRPGATDTRDPAADADRPRTTRPTTRGERHSTASSASAATSSTSSTATSASSLGGRSNLGNIAGAATTSSSSGSNDFADLSVDEDPFAADKR